MADEGIKAGDAYIVASLRLDKDAWKKLAADNTASASKAGDDLGDRIGKAISKKIAQSVRDGLNQSSATVGAQGTKAGDDYGGKFADTVKKRIDAALKSLPQADVRVDAGSAEEKLRDLRTRLEELSSKRVGVGISAEDALAEIRDIKVKLDDLGARSPDIRVRTDALAAVAELAAVDAELEKIDGKNPKADVKTNADQAAQQVFSLANALAILGPAAVPSAAAAAAAILGIGVAATSVFAAIGVGKLAFQGVGGALTAIDNAQQGAAKSGATLAQQQNQLASGADSVKSAEASLTNTRASAADSIRQANERVTQSQQTLTDAERAAQRAQVDLTTAQKDASRQIEDLNTAVEDGALAQRRALEDQQKAQAALNSANLAGSTATAAQRADAQLVYDEAVQHVKDLNIQQTRAVQDRDAANAKGVAGSKQVVAAQDAIYQANQKVADAQRGIADAEAARTAASRQAAFSIAQAQQSVASSQRSMGQALVATSITGGAAVDALQLALSKLSPEGQKFAYFLYGLKPRLDELKQSAQAGLFPGLQAGITTVLPYFGQLDRLVGTIATDLGGLSRVAATTFTSPFWAQFGGFLAAQIVPNLHIVYLSLVNVAEGGARIIQAFAPVGQQVGTTILGLTDQFVSFSRAINTNQGLQQFIKYVQGELPHVISTVESLGVAGVHIIQAYAPIGSVVVSGIRLLSGVIGAIPVPVVTALAAAFTAYRVAAGLSTLATSALNSGFVQGVAKMVPFRTQTSATLTTTTGLQRAVQGATGALGGAGLTTALVGATLVIGLFVAKQQEARANLEALKGALGQYGDALKGGVTNESADAAKAILQQNAALRGLVTTTSQAGISTKTLVDGLNGDRDARGQVIDALQAQIDVEQKAQKADEAAGQTGATGSLLHYKRAEALITMRKAFAQTNTAQAEANDLTKQLTASENEANSALSTVNSTLHNASVSADDYKAAIGAVASVSADAGAKANVLASFAAKVADSQLNAADKATVFGEVLNGIGESATTNGPVFESLSKVFESISRTSLDAHDKVNLLTQALQGLYQPSIDLNEANENLVKTQVDLKTQMGSSSAGFDINTKASGANKAAILQNADALEAALQATRQKYVQDLANKVSEDDARATHDKSIKSILDGIPIRQRDTQAVKDLVTEYGDVPPKVTTDVSAPGLDAAINQLAQAHAIQLGLNATPPWSKDLIDNEYNYLVAKLNGASTRALLHAEGGPISGPGTATSDSIPAWLSDGEFVHRTAAVDYYGVNLMKALNAKAIPREALPGFAGGGSVSWPINIPASPQPPVPLTELWKQWKSAQTAASNVGGAVGALGPLVFNDSGVSPAKIASIKAFLHSVDPLPYVFGAVGPKAFDCSGLVGEIWAQLTGHASDRRYFTTYDFANGAPGGFKPGANGGILAIGVNPQEHMAGNFDGLPFEAKSTAKGIVVGAGVTPTGAFQQQFHLAEGGLVSAGLLAKLGLDVGGDPSGITVAGKKVPHKLFDDGGWLPQGLTLVDNRTGEPELVQNREQIAANSAANFNVVVSAKDSAMRELLSMIDVRVEAGHDRVAAAVGSGVRDY